MPQDPRLGIEDGERGSVRAAAAPQSRSDRAEKLARIELRHDRVGDIEKQIELIALALKGGDQVINR
jgi:hypothetical protein